MQSLYADFVIGADGATSEVAAAAGLVDPNSVLWGFAVRTYLPQVVDLPAIVLWEPTPWRAFPGYGWVFPGEQGGANIGLGIGTRSDRKAGARAVRALPDFLVHLHALGLLDEAPPSVASAPPRRLAQDGDRRDHAREGAGPPGGRCRRPGEPDAGGGDLPSHDQRPCSSRDDPQQAEPRRRGISVQTCR